MAAADRRAGGRRGRGDRRALRAELEGGRSTGLRPFEADGELRFVHRFGALTAHRPGD